MMHKEQSHHLRRTVAPYTGQIVILALVTIGVLFVVLKTNEWKMVISVPVMWAIFLFLGYLGLKYKIYWTEEGVCQEADGGHVCMKYKEITSIRYETSTGAELISASRPFRRIAIYAVTSHGKSKRIDVSLKHFVLSDVDRLMHAIHDHRPELAMPKYGQPTSAGRPG